MKQIEEICVVHNKYIEKKRFFICLIIFLLIRELFFDDCVTLRNHARHHRLSSYWPASKTSLETDIVAYDEDRISQFH